MRWLLDLLFPPRCVSCKTEGDFLCRNCVSNFKKTKIKHKKHQPQPPKEFEHLDGVIYALDYEQNPEIQAAIKQFKYKFTQELAIYFAHLLDEKLDELQMIRGRQICLIPVPLHRQRLAERGFNQADLISNALAKRITKNFVIQVPLLLRARATAQQAKLNKAERHKNLSDAFIMNKSAPHPMNSETIHFLVDDVCTTGSTLENCAKVLKLSGIEKVYGLVVARAFK